MYSCIYRRRLGNERGASHEKVRGKGLQRGNFLRAQRSASSLVQGKKPIKVCIMNELNLLSAGKSFNIL